MGICCQKINSKGKIFTNTKINNSNKNNQWIYKEIQYKNINRSKEQENKNKNKVVRKDKQTNKRKLFKK